MDKQLQLGTRLIFRTLLMLVGVWFLYMLRDVVVLVFLSIVVAAALNPAIARLVQWRVQRSLAVVSVYLCVLGILGVAIYLIVPPFGQQLNDFFQNSSAYLAQLYQFFDYLNAHHIAVNKEVLISQVGSEFSASFSGIFTTTVSVVSGLISFVIFFFLSLYLSLEEKGIETFFLAVTPNEHHDSLRRLTSRMQTKISHWMVGQFLVMLTVFLMYWIGLTILGVPYALLIALAGGFLEIVPYVGPVMAAVPAVLVASAVTPWLGFLTLLFYTVSHQLEGHIITPQIMKRAVGLNPVVVIIALLIGGKLGGILGVILAVPLATVLSVFLEEYLGEEK